MNCNRNNGENTIMQFYDARRAHGRENRGLPGKRMSEIALNAFAKLHTCVCVCVCVWWAMKGSAREAGWTVFNRFYATGIAFEVSLRKGLFSWVRTTGRMSWPVSILALREFLALGATGSCLRFGFGAFR